MRNTYHTAKMYHNTTVSYVTGRAIGSIAAMATALFESKETLLVRSYIYLHY